MVKAKYNIFLSESIAIANNIDNVLILPTGTRLKLSDLKNLSNWNECRSKFKKHDKHPLETSIIPTGSYHYPK